jgi:hypothetical protein
MLRLHLAYMGKQSNKHTGDTARVWASMLMLIHVCALKPNLQSLAQAVHLHAHLCKHHKYMHCFMHGEIVEATTQ